MDAGTLLGYTGILNRTTNDQRSPALRGFFVFVPAFELPHNCILSPLIAERILNTLFNSA